MIRRPSVGVFLLGILMLAETSHAAQNAGPLPRSTPEEQGVSSAAVLALVDALDSQDQVHSVMVLRHGSVIAEGWWAPFAADDPHFLYSVSKSFTSTAVGLAIAEGKFDLDDLVVKFFPDELPASPAGELGNMRVRDLLCMSTGQHGSDLGAVRFGAADGRPTREFLALPVPHKPGTHWTYNTPATYMCSAIVQKATGQKVNDFLQSRLFEPLGISPPRWLESAEGVSQGGTGLSARTEDLAKFGQLYLQGGRWGEGAEAKQLVPADWIELATSKQASNGSNPDNDWDQGYGFQFWRCRHGAFRADGAYGQLIVVMPKQDAVVVVTSGTADIAALLNAIWDHLLPGLEAEASPAIDQQVQAKLKSRLAALSVPMPQGVATSPVAAEVTGRTYRFPKNERGIESIRFDFAADQVTMTLRADGCDYSLAARPGKWTRSDGPQWPRLVPDNFRGEPNVTPAAAAGAWQRSHAYAAKAVMFETPFYHEIVCRFAGDEVVLDLHENMQRGPGAPRMLIGQAE